MYKRQLLAKWGDLTEKYDCTMAQLVIAMTARMIPGLHVLCGARKPEQVLDNAGALHIKLDGADAVRMKWDVEMCIRDRYRRIHYGIVRSSHHCCISCG